MKEYLDVIKEEIKQQLTLGAKPVLYFEAGHYDPRILPDDFSLNSLREAISFLEILIKEFKHQVKFILGVLVDDLGLECGEESCSIKEASSLTAEEQAERFPDSIEKIFSESRFVNRARVLRFSERTTKNRAINTLRKLLKSECKNINIKESGSLSQIYFTSYSDTEVLLAEFEGNVFRAKCPAIMGQHYADCLGKVKQRFPEMTHLNILDWSEMIDFSKVTMGMEASYKLFIPKEDVESINVLNIFYQNASGSETTYEFSRELPILV